MFTPIQDQTLAVIAEDAAKRQARLYDQPYLGCGLSVSSVLEQPGFDDVSVVFPEGKDYLVEILIAALGLAAKCGQAQGRAFVGLGTGQQGDHYLGFGRFNDPARGGAKYALNIYHYEDDKPSYNSFIVLSDTSDDVTILHEAIHWADALLFRTETDLALAAAKPDPLQRIADSWQEGTHPMAQGRYDFDSWLAWYREMYLDDNGERFVIDCLSFQQDRTREQAEFVTHDTLTQYIGNLKQVGLHTGHSTVSAFKQRDLERLAKQVLYNRVCAKDIKYVRDCLRHTGVRV